MNKVAIKGSIVNSQIEKEENIAQNPIHHNNVENLMMNNNQKFPNVESNLQYISPEYSLDNLKPVLNKYLKTSLVAKNEAYDWIEYCFALLEVFRMNQNEIHYGNITYDIIQNMLLDKEILNYSEQETFPILLSTAVGVSLHKNFLPRKEQSYYKEIHLTAFTALKVAKKLAPHHLPTRNVMFLYSEIIIQFIDNFFEKNITEQSPFYSFLQKENDRFELYGHIISKVVLLPYYDDDSVYAATLYTSLMNIVSYFLSMHIDDAIANKDIVYFCKNLQEAILDKVKASSQELPEIVLGQQAAPIYHDNVADTYIPSHNKTDLDTTFQEKFQDKKTVFSSLFG